MIATSEMEMVGPEAPQSLVIERFNKSGVQIGDRALLGGTPAAEIRAELKGKFKGKALTLAVNAALVAEKSRRNIVGQGCVSTLIEDGFTFDMCDFNKAKTVATVRLIKVSDGKVTAEQAKAAASTLSDDELTALLLERQASKKSVDVEALPAGTAPTDSK